MIISIALFRLALLLWAVTVALAQTPCERLKSLSLPNTTITAAESVAAGPFRAPGQAEGTSVMLPAHCRVAAVLAPSSDSHIEIEVWLPADLEREVRGCRQWRLGGRYLDYVQGKCSGKKLGCRTSRRLRNCFDRYRTQSRRSSWRILRARPPGETDRLRLPRRA